MDSRHRLTGALAEQQAGGGGRKGGEDLTTVQGGHRAKVDTQGLGLPITDKFSTHRAQSGQQNQRHSSLFMTGSR